MGIEIKCVYLASVFQGDYFNQQLIFESLLIYMKTEMNSKILHSSLSVPTIRQTTIDNPGYNTYISNTSFNPSNRYLNGTLQPNSSKLNKTKMPENYYQTKKHQESNISLSSSLRFDRSTENQQYSVTQSQIQTQQPQQFKFQFSRKPVNTPRSSLNNQKTVYSTVNIPGLNDYSMNNRYVEERNSQKMQQSIISEPYQYQSSKNNREVEELKKKIGQFEALLKFQEKYANDLYKSLEGVKSQQSKTLEDNKRLKSELQQLQSINLQLSQQKQRITERYQIECRKRQQSDAILSDKIVQIAILSDQRIKNLSQIEVLNEKISNFGEIFRNQLYQQRVKQLNEQLCNTKTQLTNAIFEKMALSQQLKAKKEKLAILTLQLQTQGKSQLPKTISIQQKTNQAINIAFQQSVKTYQRQIVQLKNAIQLQKDDHLKLKEEIKDLKKTIENMKDDYKINQLKLNTQKNNLIEEKQSQLIDKTNENNSLKNRLKMIEERYAKALKQINDKDSFLQEHLVGRAKQMELKQLIETTMKNYIDTFQSRFELQQKLKKMEQKYL